METLKHLLDVVLHLQDHLFALTKEYGTWVYGILFAIVFAETGLVITPVLPGDSLVFAVGAVAANPESGMNIWVAAAVLWVAAVLGDSVNYWVGNRLGGKVQAWFPRLVRQEHIARTHAFFERYGGKAIIIARFVPIVRTFAPFVAGVGSMSYGRFTVFNLMGATLWIGLILPCGWYFGGREFVRRRFEVIVLGIILVSVLPIVLEWWKARRASRQGRPTP
jgi:membrane-associated protein